MASRKRNPERWEMQRKAYRKRLKDEVFSAYGDTCTCCGETQREFLTLDHKNNDGAAHRRELFGKSRRSQVDGMLVWARNNNYPDDLQLLCWNCNCAKAFHGICPHQRERENQCLS